MPNLPFAQHIITSTKIRRGFQTYQRTTAAINEQLDQRLAHYGVYNASHYPEASEMSQGEYPELFCFYEL